MQSKSDSIPEIRPLPHPSPKWGKGQGWGLHPANQYASPYVGMGNNPANRIDPDGREDFLSAIWDFFSRIQLTGGENNSDDKYYYKGNNWNLKEGMAYCEFTDDEIARRLIDGNRSGGGGSNSNTSGNASSSGGTSGEGGGGTTAAGQGGGDELGLVSGDFSNWPDYYSMNLDDKATYNMLNGRITTASRISFFTDKGILISMSLVKKIPGAGQYLTAVNAGLSTILFLDGEVTGGILNKYNNIDAPRRGIRVEVYTTSNYYVGPHQSANFYDIYTGNYLGWLPNF